MSCIAGTVSDPLPWVRLRADGTIEQHVGRWCKRTADWTSKRQCSSCPAYRGNRLDGTTSTGIGPDGLPYGLRQAEHELYEAALEAALDDDFSLIAAFETRLADGVGDQVLRKLGDPDALDRRAAYMRDYRKGRPDGTGAARQRRWRERHRNVNAPESPNPRAPGEGDSGQAPARARIGAVTLRGEGP